MLGRVFLSHATEDLATVRSLAASLEAGEVACWYADRDIPKGVAWPPYITQALASSDALVVLLSSASNRSQEVQREVALANSENLGVLCLRAEDVTLDPALKYLLAIANWMDVLAGGVVAHHDRVLTAVRRLVTERRQAPRVGAEPTARPGDTHSPAQGALERIALDISRLQDRVLMLAAVMAERPSVLVANAAANRRLISAAEEYNRDVPPLVKRMDAYGPIVQRYWGPELARRFEDLRQLIERDIYRGCVFDMNEERATLNAQAPAQPMAPEVEALVSSALARKTTRIRAEVSRLTSAWGSLHAALGQAL